MQVVDKEITDNKWAWENDHPSEMMERKPSMQSVEEDRIKQE